MAVNKNFVVKNGFEVSTDLILADATTNKVGIGTSIPSYELHVNGGIGATSATITGFTTSLEGLRVGAGGTTLTVLAVPGIGFSVGVGSSQPEYLLDVRSPVSTGQTALYVQGDVRITGDLNVDDIVFDDATLTNLTVTEALIVSNNGISTFSGITTVTGPTLFTKQFNVSGISTFNNTTDSTSSTTGAVLITGGLGVAKNLNVGAGLSVVGVSTFAGITTVTGDTLFTKQFNVSGVSTFAGITTVTGTTLFTKQFNVSTASTLGSVTISSGIVTAATGVVTYYGDGSKLTGIIATSGGTIGVGSEKTFVGSGVTSVYFATTTGTNVSVVSSGTSATVTIQPGVSLGLAIALGG